MRAVPAALAARIEAGAARLCHAWILTRADGVRLGFTDHDRDLVVDGLTCRAASGWTAGARDAAAGFAPGLATALGALDDAGLSEAELTAGLYDGAEVACRRVDWSQPSLSVTLWTGRIAAVRVEGGAFTAELEGPLAALDQVAGRAFGRLCDAAFGDARCGVEAPRARSRLAVLAGDNALAARLPDGEWRVLLFSEAQAVGPDLWALSGLLRGEVPALAAGTPAVLLSEALVRAQVGDGERGLALTWRAAPAGGPPAGESMSQVTATWRGLALRPLSPAHLRVAMSGGDAQISWIRRARVNGDGWEAEVPLGEEREAYRLQVLDGETVVRTVELNAPAFVYTAAMRAADFPGGPAGLISIIVAQGSAIYGWGAGSQRLL